MGDELVKKQKSKKKIFITLGVVAVIVIGVIVAVFLMAGESSSKENGLRDELEELYYSNQIGFCSAENLEKMESEGTVLSLGKCQEIIECIAKGSSEAIPGEDIESLLDKIEADNFDDATYVYYGNSPDEIEDKIYALNEKGSSCWPE